MKITLLLGCYQNGNYTVFIYDNGTKIRVNSGKELIPSFAENCDVKITNKCDGNCPMCYEGCNPYGLHADLLGAKFIDSLHPYTELAINGNDLSHPQLVPFLAKLRDKKVITNMTVNQMHFERHYSFIKALAKEQLIHGLGVSLRNPTPEFIEQIKTIPNTIIHVINGIVTESDIKALAKNDLKILILGYKSLNRGANYYKDNRDEVARNKNWLYDNLPNIIGDFECVSFDNLALDQLCVKRMVSEQVWNQFYMGDDGKYTFYIDMVAGKFAKNSVAPEEERFDIGDKTIDEMFKIVSEEGGC